ncbi:geraniol 8-hydroxylase-like [Ananas comosus]|uniref:Geraniol 8-hydroxylase-like n=1 Tax=Ananas comosus TaxID=4615 RepID=A0A6P5ENP7_ANACO|nr:geraniol 8-hydroxylase-like [Ananas comosus]
MELQLMIFWITTAITLLYVLSFVRAKISGDGCRLPPGPRLLPIVGNMLMVGKLPHRTYARLAKAYGHIFTIKFGQALADVVVSSPEIAREVLQKQDPLCCDRWVPDAAKAHGHNVSSMSWLPVDQQWLNLRKLVNTELVSSQRLGDLQALRHKKARELAAYLREKSLEGEPVNIGGAVYSTTLNTISNLLFSLDVVHPSSEAPGNFKEIMWGVMYELSNANISDFFPLLAALDLQGRRRRLAVHFRRLHEVLDKIVDQRIQENAAEGTYKDFLEAIIHGHSDGKGLSLDRHTVDTLLGDLFIGAADTTTTTIEWAMAEVLRNPRVLVKLREEVKEAFKEGEVNESVAVKLPYLQAVVKETLRLHTPVPFLLPHKTVTTVELCGYTIPKGTRVLVNFWAIGRDRECWRDPDEFIPERFLEREVDYVGQNFEFIPFSSGRRRCPGYPLAYRMLHLMLAALMHFDWKLPDGMEPKDVDMSEKFGVTLAMAVPLGAIPVE